MPGRAEILYGFKLLLEFLHPIFPEMADTGFIGCTNGFRGMRFRDADNRDLFGLAPNACRGPRNALADPVKIGLNAGNGNRHRCDFITGARSALSCGAAKARLKRSRLQLTRLAR